ncbi:hypothetical protein ElyMa_001444400 [Elysia marginata]|uniref:Uncharacterized protein n=1 Tax=Elysia marginata TaxID=1093978 RepID=A0AAV4J1C2_9GAST|nr:hypothetical protein ElyMa_001444400 [Elysia marginata]
MESLIEGIDLSISESALVLTENFEAYLSTRAENKADPQQAQMKRLLDGVRKFKPETLAIEPEVSKLRTIRDKLEAVTNPTAGERLSERCDTLKADLAGAGEDLSNTTRDAFKNATGIFANRMRHVFQQGAHGLHQAVASEIGVCKPLSNVYDDLLRQSTCSYIVGSLVSCSLRILSSEY